MPRGWGGLPIGCRRSCALPDPTERVCVWVWGGVQGSGRAGDGVPGPAPQAPPCRPGQQTQIGRAQLLPPPGSARLGRAGSDTFPAPRPA